MHQRTLSVLTAVSLIALSVACTSKASAPLTPTPPTVSTSDGSTLKASTPTPQSPVNDVRLETFGAPTLTAGGSTPTHAGSATLQYEFELLDDTGARVDSAVRSSTNWTPTANLQFDKRYTWRVRAVADGAATAWATASFLSPNGGFIRGQEIFDPLTNGQTVGVRHGGHFEPGRGWMADNFSDGIDYNIPTCDTCTLEFDVTNFNEGEGGPFLKDLKWISMGDATAFGDFAAFRNHPWKMHLEQRGDGDGSGMKLIWRNGCGDCGDEEPGDHTQKKDPAIPWNGNIVYHFTLTWNPGGFEIWIGETQPDGTIAKNTRWFDDGFGGHPYAPPNHVISLGTRSRGETLITAIWRNIQLYPGGRRVR